MSLCELAKIQRLAQLFGGAATRSAGISLGIGDDAAVLRPEAGRELVWTVDAQIERRHFRREWMTLEDIGWRSFVAAASDVAAMGANPWCALAALGIPDDLDDEGLDALARGQAEAARAASCPIVGGNLSRAGELSITTTLLGAATRVVRREGARAGDGVWIAGEVGMAGLGLRALDAGRTDRELAAAIALFRRPHLRIESGRVLGEKAHAAIDVSDGLASDVAHLALASGVLVVIDEARLAEHVGDALPRAASVLGDDWLERALRGGEDYALVAASSEPLAGFTRIGEVETGLGVCLHGARGERRVLDVTGFDHFTACQPPAGTP